MLHLRPLLFLSARAVTPAAAPRRELRRRDRAAVEVRARCGNVELRAVTDAEKASGYIGAIEGEIPYNSDSHKMRDRARGRHFVERLAPGVFKRSLAEDKDIMAFAGHTEDPLAAFARVGENLTFTDSDSGLHYRSLIPDTQAGRDLVTLVQRGIIKGTSFEFEVRAGGEKRESGAEHDVRTITDARLFTVNPVADPAYPESELTVAQRSRERAGALPQEQADATVETRGRYLATDASGRLDWYDPTLTPDAIFAGNALNRATWALTDALEYLRAIEAAPATGGALVDYARAEVAASTANAKAMLDWLAANGTQINPAAVARAQEKQTEARSALGAATLSHPQPSARERLLRIL